MATALEESVFVAMGRSGLSFWKWQYGVRSAIFLETPKSWSVSLRKAEQLLLLHKTRRPSKPDASNNNMRWSG